MWLSRGWFVVVAAGLLAACDAKEFVNALGPSATIVVTPAAVSLEIGDTISVSAIVNGGDGSTSRTVRWQSFETRVASVAARGDNSAVITALAEGTTVVRVTNGDPRGDATVRVTVRARVAATPDPPPISGTLKWQESVLLEMPVQASRAGLDIAGLRVQMQRVAGQTPQCPANTVTFGGEFIAEATVTGTGPYVPGPEGVIRGHAPVTFGQYVLEYEVEGRVIGGEYTLSAHIHHPDFMWAGCEAMWTGKATIPGAR